MKTPDIRLYLGKSGSGKTHLALHQLSKFRRVLIHDPNLEPAHKAGAEIAETKAQLLDLISVPGPVRICWRGYSQVGPGREFEIKVEAFEWANHAAWCAERLVVLWDEVDRFLSARHIPPWADQIVNAGRHRGLRIFACARRPAKVHRDLTANATRILAFHSREPLDVKYLIEWANSDDFKVLPSLRGYQALDWTEAGSATKKSPFS